AARPTPGRGGGGAGRQGGGEPRSRAAAVDDVEGEGERLKGMPGEPDTWGKSEPDVRGVGRDEQGQRGGATGRDGPLVRTERQGRMSRRIEEKGMMRRRLPGARMDVQGPAREGLVGAGAPDLEVLAHLALAGSRYRELVAYHAGGARRRRAG